MAQGKFRRWRYMIAKSMWLPLHASPRVGVISPKAEVPEEFLDRSLHRICLLSFGHGSKGVGCFFAFR